MKAFACLYGDILKPAYQQQWTRWLWASTKIRWPIWQHTAEQIGWQSFWNFDSYFSTPKQQYIRHHHIQPRWRAFRILHRRVTITAEWRPIRYSCFQSEWTFRCIHCNLAASVKYQFFWGRFWGRFWGTRDSAVARWWALWRLLHSTTEHRNVWTDHAAAKQQHFCTSKHTANAEWWIIWVVLATPDYRYFWWITCSE